MSNQDKKTEQLENELFDLFNKQSEAVLALAEWVKENKGHVVADAFVTPIAVLILNDTRVKQIMDAVTQGTIEMGTAFEAFQTILALLESISVEKLVQVEHALKNQEK
jgi:hypothetical protein